MAIEGFTLTMSILNFTGGILSALGSGFIILCYLALPLRRHFRHVLILNLAVADFINSVNNSASGSQILMKKKALSPGPACVLNGFIGQISVQAADCAILAIAVVTVYTITKTSHSRLVAGEWEWPMIIGVTGAIWLLPFTTSFLALGKHWYAPVSGNWCWLVNDPVHLRYVLTHGWRYLFMLLELILYTYLHIFLRKHFRRLAVPIVSNVPTSSNHFTQSIPLTPVTFTPQPHADSKHDVASSSHPEYPASPFADDDLPKVRSPLTDNPYDAEPSSPIPTAPSQSQSKPSSGSLKHVFAHRRAEKPSKPASSVNPRERAIQRVLLLNAYPLLYIILWIPGLANRIIEASGGSSRVTQVMQASTQFVGLANALTYGWNERIMTQLKDKYRPRY